MTTIPDTPLTLPTQADSLSCAVYETGCEDSASAGPRSAGS
jgi:hypothetical protein